MMLIQLLFVLFVEIALGDKVVRLKEASEFIKFSNNVTSGTNYFGTTVLLNSDLSFSGKTLEPTGGYYSYYATYQFRGVFDGQGHTISDLKMNSTSGYTGLFGYSNGLTIKNVVLDSSCSITSLLSDDSCVYVGGIIGYCSGQCNIENSVNMANVMSSGNNNRISLYLGGITGFLSSSSYGTYVKNCVNYGSVTHSGTSGDSRIGGIVGALSGSYSSYTRLYNSLNYGALIHSGTTSIVLYLGGISGYSNYAYIENCVGAGKIFTQNIPSKSYIGSIMGYVGSYTHINYCYYTSDVNVSSIYGRGTPSTTGTPDTASSVDPDLVSKLNSNATSSNWSKWLLNANKATVTFKMGDNKEYSFSSQIILTPNPAKEGNNFLFWCKDAECNEKFDPAIESVSGNTDLYAAWVNYTVTFDFDNGTTMNETFTYNTEIIYPDVKKEGYIFSGWDKSDIVHMPAQNIIITAQWTQNNYTVTFDFDNGTTVNETFTYNTSIEYPKNEDMMRERYIFSGWDKSDIVHMPAQNITITALWKANNYVVTFDANGGNVSATSMIVTFNSSYGPLPTPTKEGYMFLGWFTDNNMSVKSETIVSISDNHTLHAQWEKTTNQVEIVFNTKDLSKEDVVELVKKYTGAKFTITEFEEESGEIRVIIKFISNEDASRFVRNANELSRDNGDNLIKRIGFVPDNDASFSLLLYPTLFLTSLL